MTPYERAKTHIGTWEWKDGHNPKILEWFGKVGHSWVKNDETAWCAAFVGAMLEESGIESTKALNARAYLEWGKSVPIDKAQPGDIVVFWRGNPNGWQGHVGFFHAKVGDNIRVLGGNQRDQVNLALYPADRLLGVRTAPGLHQPKDHVPVRNQPSRLVAWLRRIGFRI